MNRRLELKPIDARIIIENDLNEELNNFIESNFKHNKFDILLKNVVIMSFCKERNINRGTIEITLNCHSLNILEEEIKIRFERNEVNHV